ncbi:hypothetical protein CAMRE0001_2367 [Campylobacter rectus RM3267]|uniref:Uncharacterized protein n=1 Tax=Campylobacter rectus RM3267 TaxID=553218 RepID=B9D600_CAMRE|nr:hypothetical protein CAMRE0001_2367 [Campylobacter rectus RM3267]
MTAVSILAFCTNTKKRAARVKNGGKFDAGNLTKMRRK